MVTQEVQDVPNLAMKIITIHLNAQKFGQI